MPPLSPSFIYRFVSMHGWRNHVEHKSSLLLNYLCFAPNGFLINAQQQSYGSKIPFISQHMLMEEFPNLFLEIERIYLLSLAWTLPLQEDHVPFYKNSGIKHKEIIQRIGRFGIMTLSINIKIIFMTLPYFPTHVFIFPCGDPREI